MDKAALGGDSMARVNSWIDVRCSISYYHRAVEQIKNICKDIIKTTTGFELIKNEWPRCRAALMQDRSDDNWLQNTAVACQDYDKMVQPSKKYNKHTENYHGSWSTPIKDGTPMFWCNGRLKSCQTFFTSISAATYVVPSRSEQAVAGAVQAAVETAGQAAIAATIETNGGPALNIQDITADDEGADIEANGDDQPVAAANNNNNGNEAGGDNHNDGDMDAANHHAADIDRTLDVQLPGRGQGSVDSIFVSVKNGYWYERMTTETIKLVVDPAFAVYITENPLLKLSIPEARAEALDVCRRTQDFLDTKIKKVETEINSYF